MLPHHLVKQGASWYHSHDHHSPNLTQASLGRFFNAVLSEGAYIGEIWVFNHNFSRSSVFVSVYMTEAMKNNIETATKFRFTPPPRINLT